VNVNQQLALAKLWAAVESVEPGRHGFHQRNLIIRVTTTCACGWSHSVPRQNALARAAKLRKAEYDHLLDILIKHGLREALK
jgi:hypothetical protein